MYTAVANGEAVAAGGTVDWFTFIFLINGEMIIAGMIIK